MARKTVHTTPKAGGKGWSVKVGGKVVSNHRTKAAATSNGRRQAINHSTDHYIHNRDGKIGQANSYGNDPFPPRG